MEDYRVEAVEACRLMCHSDFVSLPQLYQLRRVRDGALYRLRLPRKRGWKAGDVIQLASHAVEGNLM